MSVGTRVLCVLNLLYDFVKARDTHCWFVTAFYISVSQFHH